MIDVHLAMVSHMQQFGYCNGAYCKCIFVAFVCAGVKRVENQTATHANEENDPAKEMGESEAYIQIVIFISLQSEDSLCRNT